MPKIHRKGRQLQRNRYEFGIRNVEKIVNGGNSQGEARAARKTLRTSNFRFRLVRVYFFPPRFLEVVVNILVIIYFP